MKKENYLRMNLQFFAEGDTDPTPPATDPAPSNGDGKKEYTEREIKRMMATEKNQGRLSVYRELGFDFDEEGIKNGKDAKAVIERFKKWNDDRKDEYEKAKETAEKYEQAQKENAKLKNRLDALSLGVKPDCLDDVVALASVKVTEDFAFKDALEEIKEKYPAFFVEGKPNKRKAGKKKEDDDLDDDDEEEIDDDEEEGKKSKGTGKTAAGAKGKHVPMSTGTRLAQQSGRASSKSNFFKR